MIEALAVLPFPNIDPVALQLGPLAIRWYALAYIAGITLGWWGMVRVLRRKALWAAPPFNARPPATEDQISDLAVWIIFGVMAGGALFGFVGVLLAVPLAAAIGVLVRFALERYRHSRIYLGPSSPP